MKTYLIFGAVGVGAFALVVVCARGQSPKIVEPSPIEESSILTPHSGSFVEPQVLNQESSWGWKHIPNQELWADYCHDKLACGPERSPQRQWYPLARFCDMFKIRLLPLHRCDSDDCTSCAAKPGKAAGLFADLFGTRHRHCACPKCSGYATKTHSPEPALEPEPPLAPPPPAPVQVAPEPEPPVPMVDPPVDVPPQSTVPQVVPQPVHPELPRNEIPVRDSNKTSSRKRTRFAGYRLSDFIETK